MHLKTRDGEDGDAFFSPYYYIIRSGFRNNTLISYTYVDTSNLLVVGMGRESASRL
jgi:hypothetical protein